VVECEDGDLTPNLGLCAGGNMWRGIIYTMIAFGLVGIFRGMLNQGYLISTVATVASLFVLRPFVDAAIRPYLPRKKNQDKE
jgi:hypothetical protein